MTGEERRQAAFQTALEQVRRGETCQGGIGTLGEKTLHATFKRWLDGDPARHEVRLPHGAVADIYDGTRVTEIQTGHFSALRPKLQRLLEEYDVTVVCPLTRIKQVVWINPRTGETTPPRRSPRRGRFTDGAAELVYLLPCLNHPRLTLRLVLLDVEEHRLADGYGKGGKRHAHRVERYPVALGEELTLSCPADYGALVPSALPREFTAAQFGKAARLQGRRLSGALTVLLAQGALTRCKQGRAYIYTRR